MKWWFIYAVCSCLPAHAASLDYNAAPNTNLAIIAKASAQLNYDGTFMYQHDGHVEISHIAHRVDSAGELAKLDALSGPPHAFVRVNDAVYCYIPDGNQVRVERRPQHQFFPQLLPVNVNSITEHYTVRLIGYDTIAEHKSIGFNLIPNDAYRYPYQLWADADTGLLLKFIRLDNKQNIVGQFSFSQVDIGQAPERAQLQSGYSNKKQIMMPIKETTAKSTWRVTKLPLGYTLIGENQRDFPHKKTSVIHQVYSDGLAIISIFIETIPPASPPAPQGLSTQGIISLYAHRIGTYQITALGEVPSATLMMLVDHLQQVTP
jgi:sigma-E factor negative regulatory protein RseB